MVPWTILLFAWTMQAAQPQQSPAVVEGIVIKMGSGEPLSGAAVQLSSQKALEPGNPELPQTYSAASGQDGRFVFANVTPGQYRLVVTKQGGYVPAEYGQRTPSSEGIPFDLSPGQRMANVQLAMSPTGSIAGRIYDRDGEPLGRAQVQALRSIYKDGRRALTIVETVESDDRGEYRLFWLTPGSYYVSAKPDIAQLATDLRFPNGPTTSALMIREPSRFGNYEQGSTAITHSRRLKTGEIVEETDLPVYYPGVVDSQAATPIAVNAGMSVAGVDISTGAGTVPVHHIRGTVISATDGQPEANAGLTAVSRKSEPLVSLPAARSNSNGAFDISGVMAGSYVLATTAVSERMNLMAMSNVEMGNSDLQNIVIVVSRPFSLPARFTIEGRPRSGDIKPFDQLPIQLVRDPAYLGLPPDFLSLTGTSGFKEDGSPFTLEGVPPGDFRLRFRGLPEDAYIKSIRMGNTDVIETGLHIYGAPQNTLEIVIGASGGRVSGSVVGARQEPLPNRTVVLVPDLRLRHRRDLYKSVVSDGSGRFNMHGITPGDYQLFAWENVELGAWQDPEFMRSYESRGTPIHITEDNDSNIQVTVIP